MCHLGPRWGLGIAPISVPHLPEAALADNSQERWLLTLKVHSVCPHLHLSTLKHKLSSHVNNTIAMVFMLTFKAVF